MAKNNSQKFFEIRDRKLGDEWNDWQGTIKNDETNSNTGKRIFLGLLLLSIVSTGIISFFIWYMISPRLAQFHVRLPVIVGVFILFLWTFLTVWFTLMVLSILTEKDLLFRFKNREFSIRFPIQFAWKLGQQFGISRDKLGNSFVKVSNALIRTHVRKVNPEKLLILLPRCLQKSIQEKIITFSKKFKIPVFTVAGGERARQLVTQYNPKAIIGVACERDLVSGIQDVIDRIPVIGIPNFRPEGPCKNTLIDLKEFEKAVQTFLGSSVHLE